MNCARRHAVQNRSLLFPNRHAALTGQVENFFQPGGMRFPRDVYPFDRLPVGSQRFIDGMDAANAIIHSDGKEETTRGTKNRFLCAFCAFCGSFLFVSDYWEAYRRTNDSTRSLQLRTPLILSCAAVSISGINLSSSGPEGLAVSAARKG